MTANRNATPGLASVARHLRCPLCQGLMRLGTPNETGVEARLGAGIRCAAGHHFDVARQGYVNLLVGRAPAGADTPDMVAARDELLAEGHFEHLAKALADTAAATTPATTLGAATPTDVLGNAPAGLVVDVGAGTGYYLAAVLGRLPHHHGLALDVAKAAARRSARAHPRAGAAVCDVWRGLPLADECADVVLDVFAPRNAAEFRRVLRPDGVLLVVIPQRDHLLELVRSLGLIGVDPDKDRRLDSTFGALFGLDRETSYQRHLSLSHEMAARFVAMGPSAWHTAREQLSARLASLPEPITTTSSVTVRVYRPS